ncbi:TetR/AcrR family transcriptional regulator [Kaistia dalseonensis]|uniref:AcrR family transcriptional regulator n=1 Tax=Kaistia dalseonensis TaxID=410840 RepID=A0ABU0H1A3_9HYPH|nr:TetR/AcrR family transcriptional regulator [Kaistia dalseonensis]MCX5493527.1 TetR/AcrR family transcriptional regulator [Kaistia dalseonensis]MDQ0436087.1 AcrR family transcriptional regulator [Kaistia dalseonensis]
MARRNDHAPDELRRLAREAAGAVAREEGLRGLTVRRVAERIGYTPGTLYNLFANLDDLIVHVNGDTLDRLDAALKAAGASLPAERRARLVDAYFDFVEADPLLWSLLFEHRLPAGAELPDWYKATLDRLIDNVVAALAPLMEAWPSPEARRMTVVALWAALHGISTLAVSRKLTLVAAVPPRALGHLLVERMIAAGPAPASPPPVTLS